MADCNRENERSGQNFTQSSQMEQIRLWRIEEKCFTEKIYLSNRKLGCCRTAMKDNNTSESINDEKYSILTILQNRSVLLITLLMCYAW